MPDGTAFEDLHDRAHEGQHVEMEEKLRKVLADESLPLSQRLRMAVGFTAAFMMPMFLGDVEFIANLRGVVRDVLRAPHDSPSPTD